MADPNEDNPFEPPETDAQRSRRVGEMIRQNVDEREANARVWELMEIICAQWESVDLRIVGEAIELVRRRKAR